MANTSSDANPPAGHGGKQVASAPRTPGTTASSDRQRAADLAETARKGATARARVTAQKARAKQAAGPTGQVRVPKGR